MKEAGLKGDRRCSAMNMYDSLCQASTRRDESRTRPAVSGELRATAELACAKGKADDEDCVVLDKDSIV